MIYIYINHKTKKRSELSFPIGQAPEVAVIDGKEYNRDYASELSGKTFMLKGSGWPSQTLKRKAQMTRNNQSAGERQRCNRKAPKLVPNYKGQVCDDWKEAGNLAMKDKG